MVLNAGYKPYLEMVRRIIFGTVGNRISNPITGFSCKVPDLRAKANPFQHLAVVETEQFGRMLLLVGMVRANRMNGISRNISLVASNASHTERYSSSGVVAVPSREVLGHPG